MALRTPAFNDAKSYGFEWLRAALETGLQEGVIGAGDLKVTAAAAGGQRVDIAAGIALVKGDSGVPGTGLTQGLFLEVNDAAVANAVTLNASDVTNPRLDQIVLRVRDSSDLGSGADDALFEVVQGVATAGATLDNRNGAAALPNDRLRLADVLVPAGSSAVSAGNVRDRRPWARGAHAWTFVGTVGGAGLAVASGSNVAIPSAGTRVELGNFNIARTILQVTLPAGATAWSYIEQVDAGGLLGRSVVTGIPGVTASAVFMGAVDQLAAGSHLFTPYIFQNSGSTQTLPAGSSASFFVEEDIRQIGNNN